MGGSGWLHLLFVQLGNWFCSVTRETWPQCCLHQILPLCETAFIRCLHSGFLQSVSATHTSIPHKLCVQGIPNNPQHKQTLHCGLGRCSLTEFSVRLGFAACFYTKIPSKLSERKQNLTTRSPSWFWQALVAVRQSRQADSSQDFLSLWVVAQDCSDAKGGKILWLQRNPLWVMELQGIPRMGNGWG